MECLRHLGSPRFFFSVWVGIATKKAMRSTHIAFLYILMYIAYFNSSARIASIWLRDSLAMLTETTMSFNGAMI